MAQYAVAFRKNHIDGLKLLSSEIFTEKFVAEALGVSNKQHAKKLFSAAKKLQGHVAQLEPGTVFDSCSAKDPFTFTLGEGKVIKVRRTTFASARGREGRI